MCSSQGKVKYSPAVVFGVIKPQHLHSRLVQPPTRTIARENTWSTRYSRRTTAGQRIRAKWKNAHFFSSVEVRVGNASNWVIVRVHLLPAACSQSVRRLADLTDILQLDNPLLGISTRRLLAAYGVLDTTAVLFATLSWKRNLPWLCGCISTGGAVQPSNHVRNFQLVNHTVTIRYHGSEQVYINAVLYHELVSCRYPTTPLSVPLFPCQTYVLLARLFAPRLQQPTTTRFVCLVHSQEEGSKSMTEHHRDCTIHAHLTSFPCSLVRWVWQLERERDWPPTPSCTTRHS